MADLEDVTLDGRPLQSLRVADLKAALEERGLSKSGQKNALIKRLKGALMLENLQRTSTAHVGLQPNSQIGEEMSQNSFIKQYLAKQQELLRQRLEREAREAYDTNEQEGHAEVNNRTPCPPPPAQDVAPVAAGQHKPPGPSDGEGLFGAVNAAQGNTNQRADVSSPPASGSMAMRVPAGEQRQEQGSASSAVAGDSDDDDSEGGEEDGDDDDWASSARRRNFRESARGPAARERSGASRQPQLQHIPSLLSPQLRQPTPPPSPPPELSFPLPDTPKQSPPSPDVAPARHSPSSSSSGSSSSDSRSSSPEHDERKPGPLTLLARKMESEGAFSGAGWHGTDKEGNRQDNSSSSAPPFTGRGPPEGLVSAITHTANTASHLPFPNIPGTHQGVTGAHSIHIQGPVSVLKATGVEERDREREAEMEREKALEMERQEKLRKLEKERAAEEERERAAALEREEREKALERERFEQQQALEREKTLQRERELALEKARQEREQALAKERERAMELERQKELERQRALEQERLQREREEKERQEREEMERAKELERARALEREREERERALEQQRLERERALEAERKEKERIEREKALELERLEKERIERERALEQERIEREKAAELDRIAREKALELERLEHERKEKERLERERVLEQERIQKERKEREEKEKAEREAALEKERMERERVEREKKEELERQKALEQERLERERVLEKERKEKETALEQERALEQEKAEQERVSEQEKFRVAEKERESGVPSSKRGREVGFTPLPTPPPLSTGPARTPSTERGEHGGVQAPESQSEGRDATPLSPHSPHKKFRFSRDSPAKPQSSSTSVVIKRPRTFSDGPQPRASPITSPPSTGVQQPEGPRPSTEQEDPQVRQNQEGAAAAEETAGTQSERKNVDGTAVDPKEERVKKLVSVEKGQAASAKMESFKRAKEVDEGKGSTSPKEASDERGREPKKEDKKAKQRSSSNDSSSSESDSGSSSSRSSGSSTSSKEEDSSTSRIRESQKKQTEAAASEDLQRKRKVSQGDEERDKKRQGKESAMADPEKLSETSEETPKAFSARKISLSSSKTSPGSAEGEPESGATGARKRRWGSSTAVTAKKPSISITTDSLKSLIPDIRPSLAQDAVVDLHPEETPLSEAEDEDRERSDQDLQIRRTVTQVVHAENQENGQKEAKRSRHEEMEEEDSRDDKERMKAPEEGMDTSVPGAVETQSPTLNRDVEFNTVTPSDTLIRRSISQQKTGVSITIDDPVRSARQPSPPRGKVSTIVHVCNLVRPFTLGQLKELLGRTGSLVEEGFWIDKIKSHCYVTYSSAEEAVATRAALHGVKWPQSNPKVLSVDFCGQDELDFHRGLGAAGGPGGDEQGPAPGRGRAPGPPPLLPERELWAEREREMERRERARAEREWDRDKVREFGKPGEEKEGGPARSRSRERRRKERGKSKEKKTEKKAEDPPAKLLDDLFHKTKAAPCIYWLPLTEEQFLQREAARAERMKEREKRRKEQEEEEEKKREEERKERMKAAAGAPTADRSEGEKDKDRDKDRDRGRDRDRERDRERERENDKRRDGYRRAGGGAGGGGGGGGGSGRRSRSRSEPRERRR